MNLKTLTSNEKQWAIVLGLVGLLLGLGIILNHITVITPMKYSGVRTRGVITNRSIGFSCDSDGNCGDSYDVTYNWVANGTGFSETVDNISLYEKNQVGDAITLVYLPNNPRLVVTQESLMYENRWEQLIFGVLLAVGSITLITYPFIKKRSIKE